MSAASPVTQAELEAQVKTAIAEHINQYVGRPRKMASDIELTHDFFEDLYFDSIDVIELVIEFEERFELSIPDDVADSFKTVGDIVTYLQSRASDIRLEN